MFRELGKLLLVTGYAGLTSVAYAADSNDPDLQVAVYNPSIQNPLSQTPNEVSVHTENTERVIQPGLPFHFGVSYNFTDTEWTIESIELREKVPTIGTSLYTIPAYEFELLMMAQASVNVINDVDLVIRYPDEGEFFGPAEIVITQSAPGQLSRKYFHEVMVAPLVQVIPAAEPVSREDRVMAYSLEEKVFLGPNVPNHDLFESLYITELHIEPFIFANPDESETVFFPEEEADLLDLIKTNKKGVLPLNIFSKFFENHESLEVANVRVSVVGRLKSMPAIKVYYDQAFKFNVYKENNYYSPSFTFSTTDMNKDNYKIEGEANTANLPHVANAKIAGLINIDSKKFYGLTQPISLDREDLTKFSIDLKTAFVEKITHGIYSLVIDLGHQSSQGDAQLEVIVKDLKLKIQPFFSTKFEPTESPSRFNVIVTHNLDLRVLMPDSFLNLTFPNSPIYYLAPVSLTKLDRFSIELTELKMQGRFSRKTQARHANPLSTEFIPIVGEVPVTWNINKVSTGMKYYEVINRLRVAKFTPKPQLSTFIQDEYTGLHKYSSSHLIFDEHTQAFVFDLDNLENSYELTSDDIVINAEQPNAAFFNIPSSSTTKILVVFAEFPENFESSHPIKIPISDPYVLAGSKDITIRNKKVYNTSELIFDNRGDTTPELSLLTNTENLDTVAFLPKQSIVSPNGYSFVDLTKVSDLEAGRYRIVAVPRTAIDADLEGPILRRLFAIQGEVEVVSHNIKADLSVRFNHMNKYFTVSAFRSREDLDNVFEWSISMEFSHGGRLPLLDIGKFLLNKIKNSNVEYAETSFRLGDLRPDCNWVSIEIAETMEDDSVNLYSSNIAAINAASNKDFILPITKKRLSPYEKLEVDLSQLTTSNATLSEILNIRDESIAAFVKVTVQVADKVASLDLTKYNLTPGKYVLNVATPDSRIGSSKPFEIVADIRPLKKSELRVFKPEDSDLLPIKFRRNAATNHVTVEAEVRIVSHLASWPIQYKASMLIRDTPDAEDFVGVIDFRHLRFDKYNMDNSPFKEPNLPPGNLSAIFTIINKDNHLKTYQRVPFTIERIELTPSAKYLRKNDRLEVTWNPFLGLRQPNLAQLPMYLLSEDKYEPAYQVPASRMSMCSETRLNILGLNLPTDKKYTIIFFLQNKDNIMTPLAVQIEHKEPLPKLPV